MDPIAKLYKQKILTEATEDDINRVAKQHPDLDRDVIKSYSDNADPKPGKGSRYLDWVVKGHVNGQHAVEDAPRIKDALSDFEKHKSKLENKDINQYKHISDVENAVAPHKGVVSNTAANKESTFWEKPEHHEKIYDNGKGLKVYNTKTKEASQAIYGGGHSAGGCHTSWCTAARSDRNMYDRYEKKGENPLYQIHTPDGKVYQDEFSGDYSGGLRGADDRSVNRSDLVKEHPDLTKVPAFQGKDLSYTGKGPKLDEALHAELKKGNPHKVLAHPEAKPEHLKSIIENSHYIGDMVPSVLEHPKVDSDVISSAIKKHQYLNNDAADRIINHPKFGPEHANHIVSNLEGYSPIRERFFKSDKVKPEHIEQAIASEDNASHQYAAASPVTTDEHRVKIFNRGINKTAAMNTFKSPDLIDKHYESGLESSVASNENSSAKTIARAYDGSKYNTQDLAMHKNAPSEVISKQIANGNHEHTAALLKGQKNINTEHVDQAFAAKNILTKQAAVRHPKASGQIHETAFANPTFHGSISVSPSAKPEHLTALASSEHNFIRQNVAENKNTPKETLQTLATDQDGEVSAAATKQLKKRK